jgi:hypothetical protein
MITSITESPVTVGVSQPRVGIPINEWWGIQSERGAESSWQAAYNRSVDRILDFFPKKFGETRRITAAEANELYGIDGILKFDKDIDERDALYQSDKARRDYLTQEILDNAKHQSGAWRFTSGIAANIFGQAFNSQYGLNIDFGINAFPLFGVGSKAARAAKAVKYDIDSAAIKAAAMESGEFSIKDTVQTIRTATGLSQIYVKGGLIGVDTAKLGILKTAPNLTESILTGTTTTAVGELTTFLDSKYQDKETEYWNTVATESAAIVPFHWTMRAIGKGIGKAADLYHKMSGQGADIASTKAGVRAITGDESVDPSAESAMDPNLLEKKAEAIQVEADLTNAQSVRIRIRQETEDVVAGPNELLYLLDAEAARNAGTERGVMLQGLLDRFYGGDRSLKFFREVAALMDRAYDPKAVSPQEAFFIERFFSKDKADAFVRLNESLNQVSTRISSINLLLKDISEKTSQIRESGDLPKLLAEINDAKTKLDDALAEKQRLIAERDSLRAPVEKNAAEKQALLDRMRLLKNQRRESIPATRGFYDKRIAEIRARLEEIRRERPPDPVFEKNLSDKIVDANSKIISLEDRLKELQSKTGGATESHKQQLDKLRIQRRKLEKERYALKEVRKKYGDGIDAPTALIEPEINAQLKQMAESRDMDAEVRGRKHLAPTHVINTEKRVSQTGAAIREVRQKRAEAQAKFDKAVADNDLDAVMAAIDEIKQLDKKERMLVNRWRLITSDIDVAEHAGRLKELGKKRNQLLADLKKAEEANDFEKISKLKQDIIELDVDVRSVKSQAEAARGVRNAVEIEDEIFTYQQLIEDLESRASDAAENGNKGLSVELTNKANAAKAELQKLLDKVEKETTKKAKASPITSAEKSRHAQQRRESLEPTIAKEREAAVKRYAEKESPKAKADSEADEAAKVADELTRRRSMPASDPFRLAEGDPAKSAQLDDADADATMADLRAQLETLRQRSIPAEGKPQTPAQKMLEQRSKQIEELIAETEAEIKAQSEEAKMLADGQMAVLDCFIIRKAID